MKFLKALFARLFRRHVVAPVPAIVAPAMPAPVVVAPKV